MSANFLSAALMIASAAASLLLLANGLRGGSRHSARTLLLAGLTSAALTLVVLMLTACAPAAPGEPVVETLAVNPNAADADSAAKVLLFVTNTPAAAQPTPTIYASVQPPLPTRFLMPTLTPTETTHGQSADAGCAAHVTANLNLRAGQGMTYTILLTIPMGQSVTVWAHSADGRWLSAEYGTSTGWVNAQYVALDAACHDLPLASSVN